MNARRRAHYGAPFPACMVVHAGYWYCMLTATALFGAGLLGWLLAFELLGLLFYSRWLLGLIPYEEGTSSDTRRSA